MARHRRQSKLHPEPFKCLAYVRSTCARTGVGWPTRHFQRRGSLTGFENELEGVIERDGLAFLHCGVETPFFDRGDGGLVQ